MNKLNIIAGMCVIAAVSACNLSGSKNGGGGTGGGKVALPVAPGAGSGAIQASTLSGVSAALDELETAIGNGSIAAPTTAPTGQAILNGHVGLDGFNDGESVVGNLTVNADFDAGTVTTSASDFGEFDFSDPSNPVAASTLGVTGGTFSGSGTINSTTITSTLDGTVTTSAGNITVDADMNGNVYDNDGILLVSGTVSGAVTEPTGTSAITGGEFVASE